MKPPAAEGRLMTVTQAGDRIAAWVAAGERVVLVSGAFELLHVDHLHALAAARSLGSRLMVAVEGDRTVSARGKGHPLVGEDDRARVVAALRLVDAVVIVEAGSFAAWHDALLSADRQRRAEAGGAGTDLAGTLVIADPIEPEAVDALRSRIRERHAGA